MSWKFFSWTGRDFPVCVPPLLPSPEFQCRAFPHPHITLGWIHTVLGSVIAGNVKITYLIFFSLFFQRKKIKMFTHKLIVAFTSSLSWKVISMRHTLKIQNCKPTHSNTPDHYSRFHHLVIYLSPFTCEAHKLKSLLPGVFTEISQASGTVPELQGTLS